MANLFKFYYDFLSPISRPLWILFEHTKVRCEKIPIALRKGEQWTESYGKDVNRFHKVPAINDNGFQLSESVAIYHYLGRKEIIPERWYPKDLKTLTRIDEYLQWNHSNLHLGAGMLFFMQWVLPIRKGVKPTAAEIESQKRTLIKNLDDLETIWLKDSKFIVGDEITFADLMAVSAIEQVTGMKLFKFEEGKHIKVQAWINSVREYFGSSYQEAHQVVYKYGEKELPNAQGPQK